MHPSGSPRLLLKHATMQAPSLHGRYPLHRYYEPVRLPNQPRHGYVFPHFVDDSSTTGPGLPGSSTDLSTRAVPYHPGEPDECTHPLLLRRWQASASLADWPLSSKRNEANMGSLALRLACSPHEASPHRLLDTTLDWLPAERANNRMNTSQFTRSARLTWRTQGAKETP